MFYCTTKSVVPRWFILSAPILYPITIEFNLLVSETFLHKCVGAHSDNVVDTTGDDNENQETEVVSRNPSQTEDADEQTPLLNGSSSNENDSVGSKAFISMCIILNVVYLVMCVLVFLGYKHHAGSKKPALSLQSQLYDDIDTSYRCFYSVILITCCVVGMICCRRFGHQRSKISFLEYLLLLATSGVLFQSVKRILAFTVKWEASDSATKQGAMQFLPVYFVTEFLDIFQTLLQIVFYYYVKDAKLHDGLLNNRSSVTVLKNIITVMAMSNFALWIRDSFFSRKCQQV